MEALNAVSSRLADRTPVPVVRLHANRRPARYQIYGAIRSLQHINGVPGSRQPLTDGCRVAFPLHSLRFKLDTYAYRGPTSARRNTPFIMAWAYTCASEGIRICGGIVGEAGLNNNWGRTRQSVIRPRFQPMRGGLDTPLRRTSISA